MIHTQKTTGSNPVGATRDAIFSGEESHKVLHRSIDNCESCRYLCGWHITVTICIIFVSFGLITNIILWAIIRIGIGGRLRPCCGNTL